MALVPIRVDRTSKPPIGTPLRSDGHWSVQGLVGAWAFNEGGGGLATNAADMSAGSMGTINKYSPLGISRSGTGYGGCALPCPNARNLDNATFVTGYVANGAGGNNHGTLGGFGYRTKHIGVYGTLAIGVQVHYSGGAITWTSPNNSIIVNNYQVAAITWQQSEASVANDTASIFLNGSEIVATRSGAPFGYIDSETGLDYHVGEQPSISYGWNGSIYFHLIFKRVLALSEIASLSANPWQIYEPETVWVEVGGGGEAALFAGTIYGQSTASAQLSTAITIASQVVAAGSIAGGINTAIRLATSAQGSASASALLTTAICMAASAQGYGASTADLSTTIALAADILAASSASGALSTAIRFGGALSGSSTTTAALTNAITMAAQAAGLGSISGQLSGTVAAALFAGTVSGSSSASANLSTAVVLAAAAQGSSTAQAALSTALELAAQVNGFGSAAGTLGVDISGLAGSLQGSSEAQATLSTAIHLMGLAAGQCGIVGRLAEPVEVLAQLRVMATDPLALTISVRDPLALRVTVQ